MHILDTVRALGLQFEVRVRQMRCAQGPCNVYIYMYINYTGLQSTQEARKTIVSIVAWSFDCLGWAS